MDIQAGYLQKNKVGNIYLYTFIFCDLFPSNGILLPGIWWPYFVSDLPNKEQISLANLPTQWFKKITMFELHYLDSTKVMNVERAILEDRI